MNYKEILSDLNLLKKYDVYAFDYIEYPHKSFWNKEIKQTDIEKGILKLCDNQDNTMFYVHIPFCEQLCMFCICHKQITSDYSKAVDYLNNSLLLEIDLMAKIIDKSENKKLNIKEIYFGGGSPTFLKEDEFIQLKNRLKTIIDFDNLNQFSFEIDPRRVDENRLLFYADQGVDKLSFGIQDFDEKVQKNINRVQPVSLLENLLTSRVREKFKSINFDLLIGLPGQTKKSITNTIDNVLKLKPDRISLTYLAYKPDFHPYQRHMMMNELLPDFYRRKEIFVEALDKLMSSRYIRTGFEHFALPKDDVSKSIQNRKAYYNSFGATTGECKSILAIGRSSYSTFGDGLYYQNLYDQKEYQDKLQNGQIPIERGWLMKKDDLIRREIIKDIRTYFDLDFNKIFEKYKIDHNYFKKEFELLKEFEKDKLLTLDDKYILTLNEKGKHFSNLIGSLFDNFIDKPRLNSEIRIS